VKDNTIPLTLISILADGDFHSGEQLGERLGMSRAAINKHIQTLRDWGEHFAGLARVLGVAFALFLAWRKMPLIVVIVAAAVVTSLLRLAGIN
jgi:hypothetical protein